MFLLVLWIVTLAIVVVGLLPPGDQEVARWSRRFNVPLHSTTVDLVRAQLRRGRSIRFAFFALGIHIGMLPMYMNVIDVKRASEFSNPLTGSAPYALAAVGAFLAELAMAMASRPGQVTGVRSAALVSRHWFDYIHSFWLLFVIACLPISLIAAWFAKDDEQTLGWIWVGPALTAVAILAATVGVSVVVNRPVVALASDTPGLDDALRSDGAHHILGAAVGVAGIAACTSATQALASSWWALIPGLLTYAAIGAWYIIAGTSAWNVGQARLPHA